MDQKEKARQFNRQLDRLLAGKALDMSLSSADQRTIELARRLSLANFSQDSSIRDTLHVRLLGPFTDGTKTSLTRLYQLNISTWAWVTLAFIILLINSIGIPGPHSTIIATNLPAPVIITVPSPSATTSATKITFPALKPIPIPTPLVISAIAHAQNKPSLVSNLSNQSGLGYLGQTQTPKPDLIPNQGTRP